MRLRGPTGLYSLSDTRSDAGPRWWRPGDLVIVAVLAAATLTMTVWTVGMSLQLREDWWQWVGFDAILIAATAAVTRLAARQDPRLPVGAAVVAALGFTDGWFDVFSSPPDYVGTAVLTALVLDWPFAVFCLGVALRAVRTPPLVPARPDAGVP